MSTYQKYRLPFLVGSIFGLPIGLLISSNISIVFLVCLFSAVTVCLTKSIFILWQLPVGASSSVAVLILVIQTAWPNYVIDGRLLLILFAVFWGIYCFVLRQESSYPLDTKLVVPLVVLALTSSFFIIFQPWGAIDGFLRISQFGEDNGSWLNNLAYSVTPDGTRLSSDSGVSGGVLLGVISALAGTLIRARQNSGENFETAALILWRLYLLLMLFGSASALCLCLKRINSNSRSLNAAAGLFATSLSIAFMSGLMGPGYFTAVIAVVWLLSTLSLFQVSDNNSGKLEMVCRILAVCNLIVVGEAWFPSYIIGCLLVIYLVIENSTKALDTFGKTLSSRNPNFNTQTKIWSSVLTVTVLGAVGILFFVFSPNAFVSYVSSREKFEEIIRTGGNIGIANPLFLLGVVVLATGSTFEAGRQSKNLNRLIISMSASAAAIIMLALLLPPNELRYGPSKLFVVIAAGLSPLAIGTLGVWYQQKLRGGWQMATSFVVVLTLCTALLGGPVTSLLNLTRVDAQPPWVEAVIKARLKFPNRTPLCLNTDAGVGRNESAYECSRLSIGLVGGDRSEFSQALYTFQWANICTLSADVGAKAFSDKFFETISIIVTNRNRLSAENDCHTLEFTETDFSPYGKFDGFDVWPVGWLSSIKWPLVEVMDMTGESVTPSFDYLITDSIQPDPVRAARLTTELLVSP